MRKARPGKPLDPSPDRLCNPPKGESQSQREHRGSRGPDQGVVQQRKLLSRKEREVRLRRNPRGSHAKPTVSASAQWDRPTHGAPSPAAKPRGTVLRWHKHGTHCPLAQYWRRNPPDFQSAGRAQRHPRGGTRATRSHDRALEPLGISPSHAQAPSDIASDIASETRRLF
jgi:hypothetical protein